MSRPRAAASSTCRCAPSTSSPQGKLPASAERVSLKFEELEALRLADLEGLSQSEASSGMGVSRHTFGRVLASARKKVALSLVNNIPLVVTGGTNSCRCESGELLRASAMKIAISAEGPTLEDDVDPRFGAPPASSSTTRRRRPSNTSKMVRARPPHWGAGLIAVETVSNAGATVALSGYIGPKAFRCAAGDRHRHRPGRRQPHGGRSRPRLRGRASSPSFFPRTRKPDANSLCQRQGRCGQDHRHCGHRRLLAESRRPRRRRRRGARPPGSTSRTRSPRKRPWGSRYPCVLRTPATSAANARRSASSMPSRSFGGRIMPFSDMCQAAAAAWPSAPRTPS